MFSLVLITSILISIIDFQNFRVVHEFGPKFFWYEYDTTILVVME